MDTSWVCNPLSHNGNSSFSLFKVTLGIFDQLRDEFIYVILLSHFLMVFRPNLIQPHWIAELKAEGTQGQGRAFLKLLILPLPGVFAF